MKLKIIKTAVFIMTFAIFLVMIFIIGTLQNRNSTKPILPENINLNQPLGSNIIKVLVKNNYIYITVVGGELPDRIVVVDSNNGKIISNINLN